MSYLGKDITYGHLKGQTETGDTWGDTDISGEETRVQAICNAVWTNAVKTAYQTAQDA